MPDCARLACILLAAGEGQRFGGRKLEADLEGRMLGLHAAETLSACGFGAMVAMCNAANAQLNPAFVTLGFDLVPNPSPADGQGRSVALGVQALEDGAWDGIVIALADMPYVPRAHFAALAAAFGKGGLAVCSTDGPRRMPPAIFPRALWPRLASLSGDQGAKALLKDAVGVPVDPACLRDIDFRNDISPA